MDKLKELFKKFINKETISYLIFGILTTIVNYAVFVFYIKASKADPMDSKAVTAATALAWVIAVIFAYITNKLYVFNSKSFKLSVLLSECTAFVTARLFSGGVEIVWMFFSVEVLGINSYISKILANVIVVILNYFFSKFFIFGKDKNGMGSIKEKLYEYRNVFFSFLLAALIVTSVFAILGYYPAGENCIMRIDLYHQYAPFHEELRSKILNGESLFYSWEGGLGKEFITQLAYYTASPISFLILLFDQSHLPEAIALFIIIKVAFAGGFMSLYLKSRFKRDDITIMAFALCYSAMAFITSYFWNIMWLDAVAVFPLVALGIEKLVKEDKYRLYFFSLAFTILVNFYIAFLVCVFAVFYYIVCLFCHYTWKKDRSLIINKTINFGIISALGGGITMFLSLPAAIALSRTQASDSTVPRFEFYANVYQLITCQFIGTKPIVLARNEDLPNIYSGLFVMLCMPVYFFNTAIKKREKWLYGTFLAVMLLFSCIKPLDYAIHGFHFPSNLPHRYSFIYSFVIISMAYKAFNNIRTIKLKNVYGTIVFYIAVIFFTEYIIAPLNVEVEQIISNMNIAVNIIAILIYIVLLQKCKSDFGKKSVKTIYMLLAAVMFCEALYSTYLGFDYVGTTKRENYVKYMPDMKKTIEYLNNEEKDNFYRMEIRRFATINESALYHFKGYSQFSSLAYGGTSKLMEKIGMAATGNSYRFYDPTPLMDSMFAIKYVINKDGKINGDRYEYMDNIGSLYIYKNNYSLPLGFVVDKNLKNWDIEEGNPFDVQNNYIKLTGANDSKILNEIEVTDISYENIKEKENKSDNTKEGVFEYELTHPEDLEKIPLYRAKVKNNSDKKEHIFVYVDAGNAKRVNISLKSGNQDRELSAGRSMFDCGWIEPGDEVNVEFKLDSKGEFEKTYRKSGKISVCAAAFDYDKYDLANEKLNNEPFYVDNYGNTFIYGHIDTEKGGIVYTSIPYDKGWKLMVDGIEKEIVSIGSDGLIGIEVDAGKHDIRLDYKPTGFFAGIIVSVVCIVLYFFYELFGRLMNMKKDNAKSDRLRSGS